MSVRIDAAADEGEGEGEEAKEEGEEEVSDDDSGGSDCERGAKRRRLSHPVVQLVSRAPPLRPPLPYRPPLPIALVHAALTLPFCLWTQDLALGVLEGAASALAEEGRGEAEASNEGGSGPTASAGRRWVEEVDEVEEGEKREEDGEGEGAREEASPPGE